LLLHRQAKLARVDFSPYNNSTVLDSSVTFNPGDSETDIPLKPTGSAHGKSHYQRWDKHGRAVSYDRDPRLYAPQPMRAGNVYGAGYKADDGMDDESRESIDSVGWDMQPSMSTESIPRRFASPPGVVQDPFSSVETIHAQAPRSQGQYATHTSSDLPSNPLPSPSFPETPTTPTNTTYQTDSSDIPYYRHSPDPTDATYTSYHTAHSSEASDTLR
jgi:hypothetical protein